MKPRINRIIFAALLILSVLTFLSSCSYRNLDDVKNNARETWESAGFEIVGYQGYEMGPVIPWTTYGGAFVWHSLKRIPDNGITYQGAIYRWGKEYHIYNLTAIDAIGNHASKEGK